MRPGLLAVINDLLEHFPPSVRKQIVFKLDCSVFFHRRENGSGGEDRK